MTGCALLVLMAIFHSPRYEDSSPAAAPTPANEAGPRETGDDHEVSQARTSAHSSSASAPAPTVEEVVASKVSRFGRTRRQLVRAIARRSNKDVPPEVERFF